MLVSLTSIHFQMANVDCFGYLDFYIPCTQQTAIIAFRVNFIYSQVNQYTEHDECSSGLLFYVIVVRIV